MYSDKAVYDAFLNVLSHGYMLQNIMANYKFYAKKMVDLGTTSFLPLPLDLDLLPSFYVQSTPSCVLVNDEELINVRYNNTVIDEDWTYKNKEEREITHNICFRRENCENTCDLNLYRSALMGEDNPPDTTLFAGRQDVRLFHEGSRILYTASVCRNRDGARNIMIEYGEYDTLDNELNGRCIETSSVCEKNWSLFKNTADEVKCVYCWHPLTVGRIEETSFHEEYTVDVPELRLARGSSHGIDVGDEKWFMVHLVSYETPRRYYHSVIATDKDVRKVLRMTHPATFEGAEIEYCGAITFQDEKLHIYYSVRDECSKKMSIPIERLEWKSIK
tara:strand:- start:557 stop:1552 length:996 start_codon:yes stop_codon:yes gene_type:complete